MANVADSVAKIREATWGIDVKATIADGIEIINEEVEATTAKENALEVVFDDLVINAGNENAEIVAARGGEVSLPVRLDKVDSDLANNSTQLEGLEINKAPQTALDTTNNNVTNNALNLGNKANLPTTDKTSFENSIKELYLLLLTKLSQVQINSLIGFADINKNLSLIDSTMLSSSLLAMIAGTAGVNVTPSALSVLTTMLAENSVVSTKLDANVTKTIGEASGIKLKYGKNLFNSATSSVGYLLSNVGILSVSSAWSTSDFIETIPTTLLTFNRVRYIAQYDVYKKFISGTFIDGTVDQVLTTFTTNTLTKYIRFTYETGKLNMYNYQLELGSVATSFNPFVKPKLVKNDNTPLTIDATETVNLNYEIKPNKNLFNKVTVYKDTNISGVWGTTLTIGAYPGWSSSEFIKVIPSQKITVNKSRYFYEYDKDKTLIKGYDTVAQTSITYSLSAETVYVRSVVANANVQSLQIENGLLTTIYEDFYCSAYYGGAKIFDLKEGVVTMVTEELLTVSNYKKFVSREKYEIWQNDGAYKIWALHDDIAVRTYLSRIEISTTGINGAYDKTVDFNTTNFPDLITPCGIENILILPYTRNAGLQREGGSYRIIVITNLGQVYHNFPSRAVGSDGVSLDGDMLLFDESVIWDLPERKYPSLNANATGTERYMPGLPATRYNYYPALNTDNGYSNGGFDKSITIGGVTFPRFYQPGRTLQSNSMSFMGGFEPGDKISILGTYHSNTDETVRICIFITDDGGRSWYTKYEFADEEYLPLFTNIDTSSIAESYVSNAFALSKRTLINPTDAVKEPVNKFIWDANVIISSITKGTSTVITTATPHGITVNSVIAIETNSGVSAGFGWLLNDTASPTSGGNGVLFSVKVLSTTTLQIYEYVNSAQNNLQCRHIHFVNKIKDGWIFGTGEEYPTGFVFYMQMKEADSYANRLAYQDFTIVRLSSSEGAVQRLVGADMFDDADSTMIVAVDNETTPRDNVIMPLGRTETFSRSSVGIFKGKLADIDDMDKFTCIFEASQVTYFFKKKADAYIFTGQQGEFAISFDKGESWQTEDIRTTAQHFRGESKKYIVIDDFIIVLKQ